MLLRTPTLSTSTRTDHPLPAVVDRNAALSLKAHPAFPAAAAEHAKAIVELYRGSRLLNAIASDRGRFVLAGLATALHDDAPGADRGLTEARLREAAVRTGLCSPGRARAMIALMRWAGLLAPAPSLGKGRLAPTPALLEMHSERIERHLRVLTTVFPDLGRATQHAREPAFVISFLRAQAVQFLAGFRFFDHAPELSLLVERSSGMLILFSLVSEGTFGPEAELASLSVSDLSRRFHVSRAHVNGFLRDAETAMLIRTEYGRRKALPCLTEALRNFFAALFLFNQECAHQALTTIEAATLQT